MMTAIRVQAWKEFRALTPWWAGMMLTVLTATVLGMTPRGHGPFPMAAMLAHVVGCAALGALAIGQEYSNRTLGQLLAQPIDRRVLLGLKTAVTAILVGLLFLTSHAAITVSQIFPFYRAQGGMEIYVYGPAIAGLSLAPLLTMLCRGALAGAVFSIALPALGAMLASMYGVDFATAWRVFVGVAVAAFAATWIVFSRLSVVDGQAAVEGPSRLFNRPMPDVRDAATPSTTGGWLRSLVGKELRLQLMTFVVSGLYLLSWAVFSIARTVDPQSVYTASFVMTGFHGVVIATLAGALPAAEERHLGAAEWQVLLPVSSSRQWMVKSAMAVSVALTLAIGVPFLLHTIAPAPDDLSFDWLQVLGVLTLTTGGLYISSMSTTGLRAALSSLPLFAASLLFGAIVLESISHLARQLALPAVATLASWSGISSMSAMHLARTGFVLLAVGLWAVLIRLGLANYRSADRSPSPIVRQLSWLAVYGLAGAMVAGTLNALVAAVHSAPFAR
ncbi:MAG TPA: hypothetical protein VN700_04340 [Vicinamibacterales bacterium]|nr:hypothetical protein [Vicinamibacterales bacterium]